MTRSRFMYSAIIATTALTAATCISISTPVAQATTAHDSVTLTLAAYSTPREAYAQVIPAFQKTVAGKGVQFQTSFGASGDQSRAVLNGLPADIVAFSLAPDITRLVSGGLVAKNWNKDGFNGLVTKSIVVLGVRKGNPKHITGWADLLKPGVEVITPNPFTSGGARWNIMAAYGAQIKQGKSPAAVAYLSALFSHVSVQDSSARQELQTFVGGKGDVMIAYENEIITAQKAHQGIDYVIPAQSISIENPVAMTTSSAHPTQARAFVSFLRSAAAQTLFAKNGYRPVLASVARTVTFHNPKTLFTIDSLGGWTIVTKSFFDPQTGIMAKIERDRGVSVGS